MAISAGYLFLVLSVLSLIEGIVSYMAGKNGKKTPATIALIFAVLTTITYTYNTFKAGLQPSNIVGEIINIAFNILVIYSAYIVRKNAEA